MQYGLVFPNVGAYSDVHLLADTAHLAEEAGWSAVFVNDTIQMVDYQDSPVSDPWIAMAAIAMRTQRVKIGPWVAAPPRRRPWQLAREAVTLDHLSKGRLILAVGSGDVNDRGFAVFGEEMDIKKRAAMLDESLAILQGLWSGQPFRFDGEHYHVDEITFLPKPVQSPGIPIWIGWTWPKKRPMERAVRFEGATPFAINDDGSYADLTPENVRQLKAFIGERHPDASSYDIAPNGPVFEALQGDEQAQAKLREYEEAGATWCLQYVWQPDVDSIRALIQQGPPRLG